MSKIVTFAVGLFARLVSFVSRFFGDWLLGKVFNHDDADEEAGFFAEIAEFVRTFIEAVAGWVSGAERETDHGYGDYRTGHPELYR